MTQFSEDVLKMIIIFVVVVVDVVLVVVAVVVGSGEKFRLMGV